MPHPPDDADPDRWHRYFAMEANNRAWALAAQARSPDEDREMLSAAHAAAHHWFIVGQKIHNMRAAMLLAEVHALLGFGATAQAWAVEVRDYFAARDTADWEMAFAHTIVAHAAAVAGDTPLHKAAYGQAAAALDVIADAEDRRIVALTFDQVPKPE